VSGVRRQGRFSLTAKVGMVLASAIVVIGLAGPYFAPDAPADTIGSAYESPSPGHVFGLDYLGRDVLSRFLWGGRTALIMALLATILGYAIGLAIGLGAAYSRGLLGGLLMRASDVLLAFPGMIFVLLLVSAYGSSVTLVIVAVALANAPRIARIVRAAALEVIDLAYVEAARIRGENAVYVTLREILPNIKAPILVDFGVRVTGSILLVASVSFLGFGLQPPAADWGLIVSENRAGMTIQPWSVVPAVAAIGLLTVAINLIIDGYRGSADGIGLAEHVARSR
jgi:ABC-type dipeptide/oligopeptide/nickel transport system permease subunit